MQHAEDSCEQQKHDDKLTYNKMCRIIEEKRKIYAVVGFMSKVQNNL